MPDPKAAITEISDKLKEKAEKAGLGGADAFVDKLEGIKEAAKKGPGDILEKIMGLFEDFKKILDKAMEDPSSISPGGGAAAACASYYGNAVVGKLKDFGDEVTTLFDEISKMAKSLGKTFQDLAETMGKAMEGIMQTVKGLSGLPGLLTETADKAKGPDDIAKVDTGPMKKALDTSALSGPLGDLGGLKGTLVPLVAAAKDGMGKLADFIGGAADKLRAAFAAPFPLCCVPTPGMLAEMLKKVEAMKGIPLDDLVTKLGDTAETIGNLDVDKVKKPVEAFAADAKEEVDKLDKVVSGAKMAGSMPAVPGGVPGF